VTHQPAPAAAGPLVTPDQRRQVSTGSSSDESPAVHNHSAGTCEAATDQPKCCTALLCDCSHTALLGQPSTSGCCPLLPACSAHQCSVMLGNAQHCSASIVRCCSALLSTPRHCSALLSTALHCSALLCTAQHCSALLSTYWYCSPPLALFSIAQHCSVLLLDTAQHCLALLNTAQACQACSALLSTAQPSSATLGTARHHLKRGHWPPSCQPCPSRCPRQPAAAAASLCCCSTAVRPHPHQAAFDCHREGGGATALASAGRSC